MCNRFANSQRWAHHHPRHKAYRKFQKMKRFRGGWSYPPANVQEFDDRYELQLFAPGLTKEDFNIGVVDGILIVKAASKSTSAEETDNWRRREFTPDGFKRRFELNDGINTEAITAKYEDGVLLITLPKLDDFHTKRQEVTIA